MMNTDFFLEMLRIDSTSGRERGLADFLAERMAGPGRHIELTEVPSGTYSHSSLYIPYLSEKEANDFSKVIKDICSCSLMERKFKL